MTQSEILACFYIAIAAAVIMAIACLIQNHYEVKRLRSEREKADAKAEDQRVEAIRNQHKKPVER
tara:strand:+ start:399 stop:593 length:195 start_codon:yes stop_codon:yes gene_type:complete